MKDLVFRRLMVLACVLGISGGSAAADRDGGLANDLEAAVRSWDVEAVTVVLSKLRSAPAGGGTPSRVELRVRAGLALAGLLRVEFEDTSKGERSARQLIGQRIDVAAGEALRLLADLPESSERYRIEADLLATMIRSDFRAKKYRKDLEAAVTRALELDENNALAWVTAAKPFLFAGPKHGGDLDEAVRLLGRALELAPGLESALLLRAHAYNELGETELAVADWSVALDKNPACAPARKALGRSR